MVIIIGLQGTPGATLQRTYIRSHRNIRPRPRSPPFYGTTHTTRRRREFRGISEKLDQLSKLWIPFGWGDIPVSMSAIDAWVRGLRSALPGIVIAAAVSLGTPFWFDTFRKLCNVRSVGLSFREKQVKLAASAGRGGDRGKWLSAVIALFSFEVW
ncbi:hypothetical protein ANRL1_04228 [Anaerolineae bacterium]|nr:hypothetical protein ANRL1_04228 [Anaerolineae bacterium]